MAKIYCQIPVSTFCSLIIPDQLNMLKRVENYTENQDSRPLLSASELLLHRLGVDQSTISAT